MESDNAIVSAAQIDDYLRRRFVGHLCSFGHEELGHVSGANR